MNTTDAIALILRQLQDALSPEEARALNSWLAQDAEHYAIQRRITNLHAADWQLLPVSPPPGFFTAQRDVLRQRAAEFEVRNQRAQARIRMAAVITLAVLASLFIYFTTHPMLRTENTLSFSNAELYQVAQTLEDRYNFPVQIDTRTTGSLRFTGQFVNADVSDVLTTLRSSLPIQVVQDDHRYVLKLRN